jgi:hypothetical protein
MLGRRSLNLELLPLDLDLERAFRRKRKAPAAASSFSDVLLLEILNKRDVFDKMAKLTNMLVEPICSRCQ